MEGVYSYCDHKLEMNLGKSGKFANDECDYIRGEWHVVLKGVVLNKMALFPTRHDRPLLGEAILDLYLAHKNELPTMMFGSYVLVIFNQNTGELYLTNDLLSKHSIYYVDGNNSFMFSDSFFSVVRLMRTQSEPINLDLLGIKMMNRHHIFFDDYTYIEQIKFLKPFCCLRMDKKNTLSEIQLTVPQMLNNREYASILNTCEDLFSEGVKLQYDKNIEYGYDQIITLSGGMDSRATFLHAKKMGYGKQICFNYAEANSVDFRIAQQIADAEGCPFFFHSITNGDFLMNRDDMACANEGQMAYGGTTGLYESLKMYDTTCWGIVHTGLGGGEILGDICSAHEQREKEKWIESMAGTDEERRTLSHVVEKYSSWNSFSNMNDIRRCLNSQKVAGSQCEYMSPFLYEPFFAYLLSVPYELKQGRKLYIDWQNRYFQCPYRSTFHLGARTSLKTEYFIRRCFHYIAVHLGQKTKYDMNPFGYWEKRNKQLIKTMNRIYDDDMHSIVGCTPKGIIDVIKRDWGRFNLQFRINVLTTTWTIKLLHSMCLTNQDA